MAALRIVGHISNHLPVNYMSFVVDSLFRQQTTTNQSIGSWKFIYLARRKNMPLSSLISRNTMLSRERTYELYIALGHEAMDTEENQPARNRQLAEAEDEVRKLRERLHRDKDVCI